MKITPEQLTSKHGKLTAPVYMVSGDEPLLVKESCDIIRNLAKQQGFNERVKLQADRSFNWSQLTATTTNISLFGDKTLLELNLVSGKPGTQGAKAIKTYLEKPPTGKVLLIITPRLDASTQASSWCKAIEKAGIFVPIWPLDDRRLPSWLSARMQQHGLSTDREGLNLIVNKITGNLLAATQEIEKLLLLYGPGKLTADQIATAITDSSRFNIFDLVDKCLAGDQQQTLRILHGLQNEGIEPTIVLWALAREIRSLIKIREALNQGQTMEKAFNQHRVWEKRKPIVRAALKRHKYTALLALLQQAAAIDYVIKGATPGNIWDELEKLVIIAM